MSAQDHDDVVMGYPVDYFERPPRNEEPTIVRRTSDPPPCNNPGTKLDPCLKCLVISFIAIIILVSTIAIFGFFRFRTKAPDIRLESIASYHIEVSSNNTVSANWILTFSFHNPNELGSTTYKRIQASVFDGDKPISTSANVDYFYQMPKGTDGMNVDIFGLAMDMGKKKLNDAGEMVVSVKLDAVVWVDNVCTKKQWRQLEANCGDIKITPSMNLSFEGSGRCNVNLH